MEAFNPPITAPINEFIVPANVSGGSIALEISPKTRATIPAAMKPTTMMARVATGRSRGGDIGIVSPAIVVSWAENRVERPIAARRPSASTRPPIDPSLHPVRAATTTSPTMTKSIISNGNSLTD